MAAAEEPKPSSWGATALTFFGLRTMQTEEKSDVPQNHRPRARLDNGSSGLANGDEEFSLKLSRINGAINQMNKEQLQEKLAQFNLNTFGVKDVLKKRLKNHYKRQRMIQSNRPPAKEEEIQYDYLVVIDYEATCSETNENFVHEIIEFPAVLIDTRQQAVCNVFQRFCKPRVNPVLTSFCTNLTGITQAQVDKAKDFAEVFKEFEDWMTLHKLGSEKQFAVVTDGPWDMARFLKTQTKISGIPFPKWAKQWINLRKAYTAFYGLGRANLQHMLEDLGMVFQGRPHCGLDDSRNIAAIAVRLLQDGCLMRINEHYKEGLGSPPHKSGGQGGGSCSRDRRYLKTSPPKSRMTKKKMASSAGSQKKSSHSADIPQEGEDVEDLLRYLKLQSS